MEVPMAEDQAASKGPDLTKGIALSDLVNDRLAGHVEDEEVLVVHAGTKVFAISAHCTHYHGPLADGIVTGEAVHGSGCNGRRSRIPLCQCGPPAPLHLRHVRPAGH